MKTRLFAPNREEISGPEDWRAHVPGGDVHAGAWVGGGEPATPPEILDALAPFCVPDEVRARPAHATAHGEIGVFACLRRGRETAFVAGIETAQGTPTRAEDRDALAQALFGRPAGEAEAAVHGHLWPTAVATIAEAQERGVAACAIVVHGEGGAAVTEFADAVTASGGVSHEAPGIAAGTRLHVVHA